MPYLVLNSYEVASLSPSQPTNSGPGPSDSIQQVSEASVQTLMGMGFNRDDAVQELARQGGDMNKAAGVLFAKSFGKF